MTVKYLKNLKRQQMTVAVASDPSVLSKYMAGFNECTSEVTRYLNSVDGMTPDVSTRLLGHLASCLQHGSPGVPTAGPSGGTSGNVALQLAAINQHCAHALGMPSTTPLSVLPGMTGMTGMTGSSNGVRLLNPSTVSSTALQTVAASPMQLVSAKLPGGELILVLTNQQSPEAGGVCQPPAAESTSAAGSAAARSSPPKSFLPPTNAAASASCSGAVAMETLTPHSSGLTSHSNNCDKPPDVSPSSNNMAVKKEEGDTSCRAGTEHSDDDEDDSIYEEDNSRETDRSVWRPW
ncbi:hypothetical protein LSAT2_023235 [Lamellibrachia satsuma]|nr:hypothetical protein LSAT2_023235 [Lamellibrachia satsuma]